MKRYILSFFFLVISASLPLVFSLKKDPNPVALLEEPIDPAVVITEVKESFPDTENHWGKIAIDYLHNAGVLEGYTDGLFHPDEELTRAGAIKIAMSAFGLDTSSMDGSHSTFTDVKDDDWFKNFVVYGTEIGIINGYEDNTFRPNNYVSRAEALKIFLETAGFIELTASDPNFSDVDGVRDWFAKYSSFAKTAGIIKGYNDGTFQGNRTITRAEACVMIQKLIDYLSEQE